MENLIEVSPQIKTKGFHKCLGKKHTTFVYNSAIAPLLLPKYGKSLNN